MHFKTQTPKTSSLTTPLDILLADVAIRIQLSKPNYALATQRYETLAGWLERPGSLLAGKIAQVYPQGSMAIGAAISSLKNDEYDIDLIAELDLPPTVGANAVLDALYNSVRGEKGSRYYDVTTRRTRCVTVGYVGMHLDITPAIRIPGSAERTSYIFHGKQGEADKKIIANPFGFAKWFEAETPIDHDFADIFGQRTFAFDQAMLKNAVVEDVPLHEPAHEKSKALIALQLLKRWRNVQYASRSGRCPPSIMMSKVVAEAAGQTSTLFEELMFQSQSMLSEFQKYHGVGQLIHVSNPTCRTDVLTDRWPETLSDQAVFIGDLSKLVTALGRLQAGCNLDEIQKIMKGLFGENPTGQVFNDFNKTMGAAVERGAAQHHPATGALDLRASGIVTGVPTSVMGAVPTRPHTHFGD